MYYDVKSRNRESFNVSIRGGRGKILATRELIARKGCSLCPPTT